MKIRLSLVVVFCVELISAQNTEIHIRTNQLAYRPGDSKSTIIFAAAEIESPEFELVADSTNMIMWGPVQASKITGRYGGFAYFYDVDFTKFRDIGRYRLRQTSPPYSSFPFTIGTQPYGNAAETTLEYIRQQRCGYNPFLDSTCHKLDGKTMYGPMPDSTYIDVAGGWHDAGDHLRYLLTSGNTVGRLLMAYRMNPDIFKDRVDARGKPGSNGQPDVLDEAKWGLEWMLKMHPAPDQLFHQVGDDRDHIGFKLPYADTADYGWGPGRYRVVYYATGQPQGLGKYQNTSTGIANLAGRYAAAMAMAAGIWKVRDPIFAQRCLTAAEEVYTMGIQQPGCQEGTPCRAPYRYQESTWTDDMEWGAAELYRTTGKDSYLNDAMKFARMAGPDPWMGSDTARHYEFYPFMNLGHYALFDLAPVAFQDSLVQWYRSGLESVRQRADASVFKIGTPFIWCSNNLMSAFVIQCLLYSRMSKDNSFNAMMCKHRDWLLGRNPWGVSQIIGIPSSGGRTPQFPHTAMTLYWDKPINGGLNDGPVYASIYKSLKGIRLSQPDPYAIFQSEEVVYHDDVWDYSTNEPTLDGTAETLLAFTLLSQ